jgi:AbrB family looped-hinge helix DNA binding protein
MHYESNMTVKGQVTVPKDIRDALGLQPGQAVEFVLDEDGNARIIRADDPARIEARKDAFLARVRETRAKFAGKALDPGMDGLAYQHMMRGDGPEV